MRDCRGKQENWALGETLTLELGFPGVDLVGGGRPGRLEPGFTGHGTVSGPDVDPADRLEDAGGPQVGRSRAFDRILRPGPSPRAGLSRTGACVAVCG